MEIDKYIDSFFMPIATWLSGIIFYEVRVSPDVHAPLIVLWLAAAGVVTTFYLNFPNIRFFLLGVKITNGSFIPIEDKETKSHTVVGEVSHFQALSAALSSTIGLGSIAGVAIAISMGGAGAIFWMWIAGILGMTTKFVECTLGTKYRHIYPNGTVAGGPMYYIQIAMTRVGFAGVGKALAVVFAVACVLGNVGSGGMFQLNQSYAHLVSVTGDEKSVLNGFGWLFGTVLSLGIGWVVIRGIHSIVTVTDKIVPFMTVFYLFFSLLFLIVNADKLPTAIYDIFTGAFSAPSVTGGAMGAMIQGVRRAAFTSESGIGTASLAHATAKTNVPLTQGFVALLEPFLATVVISTATGLVIISSNVPLHDVYDGILLTSRAFETLFPWFGFPLTIAVFLFAVSTALTSAFYSLKAWIFLKEMFQKNGTQRFANENQSWVFMLFFCLMLVFGTSSNLVSVIEFSDSTFFLMSIPNLIAVYFLLREIKSDLIGFEINTLKRRKR